MRPHLLSQDRSAKPTVESTKGVGLGVQPRDYGVVDVRAVGYALAELADFVGDQLILRVVEPGSEAQLGVGLAVHAAKQRPVVIIRRDVPVFPPRQSRP